MNLQIPQILPPESLSHQYIVIKKMKYVNRINGGFRAEHLNVRTYVK